MVTATGAASAMGRIAALMVNGSGLTPLQRRLAGVGRLLAGVAVLLCAWCWRSGWSAASRSS